VLARRACVVASIAGLAASLPAHAQTIPWLTATSGNWSDTTKWAGGNVPNAAGEIAVIGIAGTYTVTQNVNGLTLDAIAVTNPSATLNLGGVTTTLNLPTALTNAGLVVANVGTSTFDGLISNLSGGTIRVPNATTLILKTNVTNDGVIEVNPTVGGSTTTLRTEGTVTLDGSGELVLNAPGSRAQLTRGIVGSFNNYPDHTIRGHGQISAPLTNYGLIMADFPTGTLLLHTLAKTNHGTLRSAGGTLEVTTTITQSPLAKIDAAETMVVYNGAATVVGGQLTSSGAGRHRVPSTTVTFNETTSSAIVEVQNAAILELGSGAFTNNGTVIVNSTLGGSTTTLRIFGPMTIDGNGEIILSRPGAASQIIAGSSGHLTLGAGQTVRGQGQITVPLTNAGAVRADAAGKTLLLSTSNKTNNAEMGASNGAELEINGITITQGAAGQIEADGSVVELHGATVASGAIRSLNGGTISAASSTSTLDDVVSEADVEVQSGATLTLGHPYTNNGTITINPLGGGSATLLRAEALVTIDGAGEIILAAPGGRADISASPAGSFSFHAGQIVRGFGRISARTFNAGLIEADTPGQTLELITSTMSNSGTVRAAGGTLSIGAITINQTTSGLIHASGSNVILSGSTIDDGTMRATAGGSFQVTGSLSILETVSSEGPIGVSNASILGVRNGLTNEGTITINPTTGGSTTSLRIYGNTGIKGGGQIVLNAPGARAQIVPDGAATLSLDTDQTLKGIGLIGMSMTVEGTIAPGLSIGTLQIGSASHVLTWQPDSDLNVELGSASSFDKITGGSHTINGGTVNVTLTGGYTPALFDTHTIIDGVVGTVISGAFDTVVGPALPANWVWKAAVIGDDVVVGATCPSDVNTDFSVDVLDFLDFIDAFGTCQNQPAPCGTTVSADFNGDTFVDVLDFLDFFDAFGSGC